MGTVLLAAIALVWLLAAEVFWFDGRPCGESRGDAGSWVRRTSQEVPAPRGQAPTNAQSSTRVEWRWWLRAEGLAEAAGRIA